MVQDCLHPQYTLIISYVLATALGPLRRHSKLDAEAEAVGLGHRVLGLRVRARCPGFSGQGQGRGFRLPRLRFRVQGLRLFVVSTQL